LLGADCLAPTLQPLIREAADGDSRNVLLLLEAGADLEATQENKIGFSALNQAVSMPNCCLLFVLLPHDCSRVACVVGGRNVPDS
jgi:hypothetical protein